MKNNLKKEKFKIALFGIIVLEVSLLFLFALFLFIPFIVESYAIIGVNNVTVTSYLQVGRVYPEITSISVLNGASITLTPNSTTSVVIEAIVRDYDGESNVENVSVVFFNSITSSYAAGNDNNRHYTNVSCSINTSYGDIYEVNATCIIPLEYYSEPGSWNISVNATDNYSLSSQNSTNITVNSLLALGLPDSITYGLVNATEVSLEKIANVTNFGNVMMNLSLKGYAVNQGDNMSMNCTFGSSKNISIIYERYNLTASNTDVLNLAEFTGNYTNLTSSSSVVRGFNLPYRQNDPAPYVDDTNSTYWRIYVPLGVAGSCQGNIVFGAVQSPGV